MPKQPPEKLRIGFVFDDSLDRPDGVQQYLLTLGGWMSSRGHDVHYIVGSTKRTDIPNLHSVSKNLQVRFNGNKLSIPRPVPVAKLQGLLQDLSLDIIHVQAPYSPMMGGRVVEVCDAPVVATFHTLPYTRLATLANRALAFITRKTDKKILITIAATSPAVDFAENTYQYRKVVKIPHAINVSQFSVEPASVNSVPKIVFLGRLVERKGAQHIIDAVAYMYDNDLFHQKLKLVIAGKGPLLDSLKQQASVLPVEVEIEFPGFVPEEDKASLLESGDVVALPSTSGECFGISVVEALKASRGVVLAGDNLGYSSVLEGLSELLVDPKDTPRFAVTLAGWLEDAAGRKAMAVRQKSYADQFDIEKVGPQVEDVYFESLHK